MYRKDQGRHLHTNTHNTNKFFKDKIQIKIPTSFSKVLFKSYSI